MHRFCPAEAHIWWDVRMPLFVRTLLDERKRDASYHAEDVSNAKAEGDKRCSALDADLKAAYDALDDAYADAAAAEAENELLRGQLRAAAGREEALFDVMDRCKWGERVDGEAEVTYIFKRRRE